MRSGGTRITNFCSRLIEKERVLKNCKTTVKQIEPTRKVQGSLFPGNGLTKEEASIGFIVKGKLRTEDFTI